MADIKVLVVDDDIDLNEFVCLYLENENYQVLNVFDGKEALKKVVEENPNVILLDVCLPDISGYELCKKIRKLTLCPIIFMSKKSSEIDIVKGLESGGDDYITKPFGTKELIARVKSQIRRQSYLSLNTEVTDKRILKLPNLTIDYDNSTIILDNRIIQLSVKEFDLFNFFVNNPNTIFTMDDLYDKVWQTKSFGDTRTVMVHISNLRKKIERDASNPKYIINIRGLGYKFILPEKFH